MEQADLNTFKRLILKMRQPSNPTVQIEMDLQNSPPVLRCGRCNKPFDKQSSLKRHGYYCRTRKAETVSRSRSCISCAKGKVRCDRKLPSCSRCRAKATECRYLTESSNAVIRTVERNNNPSTKTKATSVELNQGPVTEDHVSPGDPLVLSDPSFGDISWNTIDWDDPNIDLSDILNPQTNENMDPWLGSSSSISRTASGTNLRQRICSPNYTMPRPPTSNVRSIVHRPRLETKVQRTADLIIYTLKSYPRMMLHHNTLPPFIHPHQLYSNIGDADNEPLTNCMNLMHMISSGYQGSRKLFWKNVRLECEQLLAQSSTSSSWKLLSAMQAITIYLLVRLEEGERDYNNADFLLISAVAAIAQRLNSIDVATKAYGLNQKMDTDWQHWIFEESTRRICAIYRVVNMLVYFEPASMCNLRHDLVLAPLPARKQLWEANDGLSWQMELQSKPGTQTTFGLATNGELVQLDEAQLHSNTSMLPATNSKAGIPLSNSGNWEEWCSGMDSFGGLVMLTASFVI